MAKPTLKYRHLMSSREIYLRLLGHVRPYWGRFALAIVAMVILAISEPAIPALLKPLLDGTFVENSGAYASWTPIAIVVLFLIRGVTSFVSSILFESISSSLVFDLRQLMMQRLLRFPKQYFDQHSTGSIVNKVTYNVSQLTAAATNVLMVLVKDTISVIGLIAYMLWLNWMLTLAIFLMIPTVGVVVRVVAKRLRRLSRQLQATMGDLTHALEETARGESVIKIFGGHAWEQKRFNGLANWVRRYHVKIKVAGSVHTPIIETVGALMFALLIYVGTNQTMAGELTVGGFVAFLTAMGLLFPPIKRLAAVNQPLQRGLAAAETVFELIDQPVEPDSGTREIDRAEGRVEFRDVSFRYLEGGALVLDGVSFVVEPGQTLALVGPSGGGKSTIASLLPRFYQPESGEILLDGIPIHDLKLENLRANLSMVGQDPMLFNDSVAANMTFGRQEEVSRARLEEVARMAHALDFIQRMPDGFESLVGEDGTRLSGGQRQRLAIARAMLKDAPVLILDEATSALDVESERHVQAALQDLTSNRTSIIIAHRLSTIEHADKILVIKDGRIVEEGTHATLLAAAGVYAQLYQTQFQHGDEADSGNSEDQPSGIVP